MNKTKSSPKRANRPGKKLPISVCMVVYNEEKLIRRALDSCADLVDEFVIVHDGECRDQTLKIAREYTNKVFVKPAVGSPEPYRPFSFSQAKNEWILLLDADEYLADDFRASLGELIKHDVSGYRVNWVEKTKDESFVNMTKEVLCQKSRIYFIGAPCEYIKPLSVSDGLKYAKVGLVNEAQKSNYDSWSHYFSKYSQFAKVQAELYTRPFSSLATWNYPANEWDRNTKLKIAHPLLLGVLGMNIKYLVNACQLLVGKRNDLSWPAITKLMWYNSYLYLQVAMKQWRTRLNGD